MAVSEPGSVLDLLRRSSKPAAIVVAVALLAGAGYYFWRDNQRAETLRADRAYQQAQVSLASGNRALAQSDLQKLIDRSPKTMAGIQSASLLATLKYEEGKHQEGIALLQRVIGQAPDEMKPGMHALIAAGYEDQKKAAEAAAEFRKAAELTPFRLDKQKYLADAARALTTAGQAEAARKIWAELAEDELSPTAGEARVRLGELSAKPASRS
jgi:predicted negative regulator of RcsB-dependent stress response